VKPIEIATLRSIVRAKLANAADHPYVATLSESVASILERELDVTIREWMALVEQDQELTCIALSSEERTGHLPDLLAGLIHRLRHPSAGGPNVSIPARQHGDRRRIQGYTAAKVVEESRILQMSIFNTLQQNLSRVDFSRVLLDVITVADEVDPKLKQALLGYFEPRPNSTWAAA
jgi:hypothetical protein